MNYLIGIGIICPCKIEYEKCKEVLNLLDETRLGERTISSKKYETCEVTAIFAGPGKIQCAAATQLIIDKFKPDIVLDVGGAGALSEQFKFNDIVLAKEVYEFDICKIEEFKNLRGDLTSKTIFSNLTHKSKGDLYELIKRLNDLANVNIKLGNIASGEYTIKEEVFRDRIHNLLDAHACNWETSAVIKVANINRVKGLSLRVITDNADGEMENDFYGNWGNALEKLYMVVDMIFEKGLVNELIEEGF